MKLCALGRHMFRPVGFPRKLFTRWKFRCILCNVPSSDGLHAFK